MPIESPVTKRHRYVIGDDRPIQIDVVDKDGAAKNMNGWALTFEIKATRTSTTALISKTTVSGITIGDGAGTDDRASITISDADAEAALSEGVYWCQLRRTDAGSEELLQYGSFEAFDHGYGT